MPGGKEDKDDFLRFTGYHSSRPLFFLHYLIWAVAIVHVAWLSLHLLVHLDLAHAAPLNILMKSLEPALTQSLLTTSALSSSSPQTPPPNPTEAALEWISQQASVLLPPRAASLTLNDRPNWLKSPANPSLNLTLNLETVYQTLLFAHHVHQHQSNAWNLLARIPTLHILMIMVVQLPILLSLPWLMRSSTKQVAVIVLMSALILVHSVLLTTLVGVALTSHPKSISSTSTSKPLETLSSPFSTGTTTTRLTFTNGRITRVPITMPSNTIVVLPLQATEPQQTKLASDLASILVAMRHHVQRLPHLSADPSVSAHLSAWNQLNMSDLLNVPEAWRILMEINTIHLRNINSMSRELLLQMQEAAAIHPSLNLRMNLWINSTRFYNLPTALESRLHQWITAAVANTTVVVVAQAPPPPLLPLANAINNDNNNNNPPSSGFFILDYHFLLSNTVVFGLLEIGLWSLYLYYYVMV